MHGQPHLELEVHLIGEHRLKLLDGLRQRRLTDADPNARAQSRELGEVGVCAKAEGGPRQRPGRANRPGGGIVPVKADDRVTLQI